MKLAAAEYEAINTLTQQTDYRGLCDSLLSSIESIARTSAVTLVEVYDDRGHTSWKAPDLDHLVVRHYPTFDGLAQPNWLTEGLAHSPQSGTITTLAQTTGELICIGGLSGVWRFVEITGSETANRKASIVRIAGVFANLMRLIDRFERDPLTGLLNRQSFDYRFEDLLEYHHQNPRRLRTGDTPWLAITDIDHFKRVNDTYGHLFGDEILLLVSRIMRQCFRFDDLLFRYGGEEFIVILNNTNIAGAELALERFRKSIEDHEFPRLDKLTVSTGWAAVGDREFSTDVIHKADKALYYAKGNGRNQVVSYEVVFGDEDTSIPESER